LLLADTLYVQGFLGKAMHNLNMSSRFIGRFPCLFVGLYLGLQINYRHNEQPSAELLEKSASILGETNNM